MRQACSANKIAARRNIRNALPALATATSLAARWRPLPIFPSKASCLSSHRSVCRCSTPLCRRLRFTVPLALAVNCPRPLRPNWRGTGSLPSARRSRHALLRSLRNQSRLGLPLLAWCVNASRVVPCRCETMKSICVYEAKSNLCWKCAACGTRIGGLPAEIQ